jgi:diguanylate cyclase (GGDEF)-like protein
VRQIALLQEEVTALTGQVENLNGDNKKWRQLIGKDALIGLPNGLALLRIYLSKVVRGLAESGSHSCIAIGLDHVGKMNLQHGWQMGNLILVESVKGLRKLMRDGEELFRLDGVNFVIAGMMDANAARQRASEIRRVLGAATVKVEETVMPLSSSLGVVTVERRSSDSDMQAAAKLHRALINTLYRAKDKGGNNWDVHNITNF